MISLDAVRAAALSDQPWSRLDDLVRTELAVGRRVAEIAAEFAGMVDAVYATPRLSADGEDAFGNTLDALTGNCRAANCYRDPLGDPPQVGVGVVATAPRTATDPRQAPGFHGVAE